MLTTSNFVSPLMPSKTISPATICGSDTNVVAQKYDSACFGEYSNHTDSSFMNLVSHIAQEVRTATTTADIRELHLAVQSGDYTPNPVAIAEKMLFFSEG